MLILVVKWVNGLDLSDDLRGGCPLADGAGGMTLPV